LKEAADTADLQFHRVVIFKSVTFKILTRLHHGATILSRSQVEGESSRAYFYTCCWRRVLSFARAAQARPTQFHADPGEDGGSDMSKSKKPEAANSNLKHGGEAKAVKSAKSPELKDADLDKVAGGLNPQPLPPRRIAPT
jgi:hypothetical protein